MVVWWRSFSALGARLFQSRFLRNTSLLTLASLLERGGALLQTVLIARAIGRLEYGVYGLLFSTLGFVASVAGLQMGLTGTVLLSRYLVKEKEKAAAVIAHVTHFSLFAASFLVAAALLFGPELSVWLFKKQDYTAVVRWSGLLIAMGMLGGVQSGLLQGFEDFRSSAFGQILGTLASVLLVYPAGVWFGLLGVVVSLCVGTVFRLGYGVWAVRKNRLRYGLPVRGEGVDFWGLLWSFSVPSMLLSFMMGGGLWFGAYLLTREFGGFEEMALVNVGQQWRGPILLIATTAATVAIPRFSHYHGTGEEAASRAFRRKILLGNAFFSVLVCGGLVVLSPWILSWYGSDFSSGTWVFALFVASTIPSILANVYLQELVARGLLWLQLWLHLPAYLALVCSAVFLIPPYLGVGYSLSVLIFGGVLLVSVMGASFFSMLSKAPQPKSEKGEEAN